MAYSTSVQTLEKILPILQPLVEGKAFRWHAPKSAKLLAYKIREGLYIARLNPIQFPELARAAGQFQIKVLGPDDVEAVQKQVFTTEAVALVAAGDHGGAFVVTGTEPVGKPQEMVAPGTAMQVIQFWMDAQPSNGPFTFPGSMLDMEEMVKLYNWATARDWLIFYAERRITLMRPARGLEGMNWTPADGLDEYDQAVDDDDTDLDKEDPSGR